MHPALYLPLAAAILGAPIIFALTWFVFKRTARVNRPIRYVALGGLVLLECAYWAGVYAFFVEPNLLNIRRETIASGNWRGPPLTIAAVSDIHVGSPHVDVARVRDLVQRVNGLKPDVIVLLGDYVGDNGIARPPRDPQRVRDGLAELRALQAPLGVYAVIGNHDAWWDAGAVRAALEQAGIRVLQNQSARIAREGAPLLLVGLDDADTGRPDYLAATLEGEQGADVIALMHSPDSFPEVPDGAALTLAGHTHCGQVTIPFIGRPIVPSVYGERYACGLIVETGAGGAKRQLFVTGGVGTSIAPLRFLNPPEIALVAIAAPAD